MFEVTKYEWLKKVIEFLDNEDALYLEMHVGDGKGLWMAYYTKNENKKEEN